jgi:hypothetical protein
MIVLRRVPCHAASRITYQIRRWLRTSHEPGEEPTPIGPKVTVTKIKFSELPAGRVLADGSHAAPIGEWLGGLETTKSSQRREKTLGSCTRSYPRTYAKTRDSLI